MTSLLENTRRPDVTFHSSGRIDITARIARSLSLSKGDVIDIATDGNEYLLYVRHRSANIIGSHEAQCWPTNHGKHQCNNFRCQSRRLSKAIIDNVCPGTSVLRLPAGPAVKHASVGYKFAVPLIIRNPL